MMNKPNLKEIEQDSIHAWILNNQIKTETGELLDFRKYRFLYDIYADSSNNITCKKCAQIGFTTYEILKTAHEAKFKRIDILYVLPTSDDVKRFSGGKTNKIIAWNPILNTWTKDKDSIEQKQFGSNTIYYQGSWTERAALMITAKKLVIDEYDRCKPAIVEQYESRLQSIADPRKAFFSNPSIPDFGVDKFYQLSDQKKWNVTHSCGKRFVMDETCVDYVREEYICPHCQGIITDEERLRGEWYNILDEKWEGVLNPLFKWSGWWIPLWIAVWMPAKKIAEYKREKTPEYFANFVAGEAYVGTNNALSQFILEKALTQEVNPQEARVIIGMDTGHNIHYTLANKDGVFFHGYCPSVAEMGFKSGYDPYDEIDDLLSTTYPNSILVADQGGDLIGVRKLQAKYPGRVFLCWFTKETKTKQLIRWGEDTEFGKVLVDRNRVIQLLVDQFNESRISVNGSVADWQPWFAHWLNMYRVKEIVDENEPSYGWRWVWKRKGADHWALSTVYAMVGLDKYAEALATIVSKDKFMAGVPTGSRADGTIPASRAGVYRPTF